MHIPYTLIFYVIIYVNNSLLTVINVIEQDYLIVALGVFLQIMALLGILFEFASLLKKK